MSAPKSLLRWTSALPRREGHYWYREGEGSEESIVYVWRDAGEWSIQYRRIGEPRDDEDAHVDFLVNYHTSTACWCYIPKPI